MSCCWLLACQARWLTCISKQPIEEPLLAALCTAHIFLGSCRRMAVFRQATGCWAINGVWVCMQRTHAITEVAACHPAAVLAAFCSPALQLPCRLCATIMLAFGGHNPVGCVHPHKPVGAPAGCPKAAAMIHGRQGRTCPRLPMNGTRQTLACPSAGSWP